MRLLTFITAMIISLATLGQDTLQKATTTEFKRLLFGVNISADYCYRTLKNNNGNSTTSSIIDLRDKSEEPKLGYTAGLNICYNFSKHLGIEAGLQYSNKGYAFKNSELTFADMIDPRYGFIYPGNGGVGPKKVKFIYNHIYLDVPVRVIFSFGEKRIQFVTSVGLTTNIFIKATQTSIFEYENGDTKRETNDQQYNFRSINISPILSAGIDYRINHRINLRVEPTIRYGILKIIDAPLTTYLWSSGLNFSCYYTLK